MVLDGSWRRGGLIYNLDGRLSWAVSHAQIPTARMANDNNIQILFGSRDELNRSHIASLEVDFTNPTRLINVNPKPVLSLGERGAFDDRGLMPSSLVDFGGKTYLYYIGWNVRDTVPYHNSVGLAVSDDGGSTFRKLFRGPVMDRTPEEPYFCATTCILIENGIWRNWYLSCTDWQEVNGKAEPRYHIKYAESLDGINWKRTGIIAIDYASESEGGIVRASVVKDGETYRMWYSYRGLLDYRTGAENTYKIGYAESQDGIVWKRIDAGPILERTESGWDSEMVAYPEVLDTDADRYMFYNGNGFGVTGFGYAVWED